MRIGIYATYLGREQNTGIEVYAEELIKRLIQRKNFEFYLIGARKKNFNGPHINYLDLNSNSKFMPLISEIPNIIKINNLDTFFFPTQYTFFKSKQNTLVSAFDVAWKYFPEYFPKSKRLAFDFLTEYAVKKSNRILSISEATKKDLVELYHCNPEKIKVAKLGFDKLKYYPNVTENDLSILEEKGLKSNQYLLFLGTLQKRKNLINIIRAYDRSDSEMPLVLAGGKGWFYDEIEDEINNSKKKKTIIQLGYIKEEEKAPLYRGSRLFLYPSLYEGFGLPVLEAMACGAIVITSNVSSLPEVIGDAGISLNPYDVECMADYINKGINGDLDYFKEKAIKRSTLFSWDETASIAMELIEDCLCGN